MSKNFRMLIGIILITGISSTFTVFAQTSVGVKEGDWAEYELVLKQNDVEDSATAKIEIVEVNNLEITLNQTNYSDGNVNTISGELGKDRLGGWVIPSNLTVGDEFTQGEFNITILGTEEQQFSGALRQVVYADIPQMGNMSLYWDKATGIAVKAIRENDSTTYNAILVNTNMWQPQTIGLEPSIFYVIIVTLIGIVAFIAVLIFRRRK